MPTRHRAGIVRAWRAGAACGRGTDAGALRSRGHRAGAAFAVSRAMVARHSGARMARPAFVAATAPDVHGTVGLAGRAAGLRARGEGRAGAGCGAAGEECGCALGRNARMAARGGSARRLWASRAGRRWCGRFCRFFRRFLHVSRVLVGRKLRVSEKRPDRNFHKAHLCAVDVENRRKCATTLRARTRNARIAAGGGGLWGTTRARRTGGVHAARLRQR